MIFDVPSHHLRKQSVNIISVANDWKGNLGRGGGRSGPTVLKGGSPYLHQYIYLRWTPHPVIVTIRDNKEYIRVRLYSCYTTITGWGSS